MSEAELTTSRPQRVRHRLLIVDDDPQTATLLRGWMESERYEILTASNGRDGVDTARAERPDLILLDLRMPGELDGLAAARILKSDPATSAVPIVLLTACREAEDKVQAFQAGADDYVTKPFQCEEVDARVQVMLHRRRYLHSLESKVEHLSASNEQLEQLLMVDEKTGLYNFREFQRRLRQEWERSTRYDVPLSLVFLDIDRFKGVNDTLGHQAGDQVLSEFAMLVTGGARANDVAARYGGEEFAVILPHTDGEMAARVAERIRNAVAEFTFLADQRPTRITVSAGVATYPSDGVTSVDALIRQADTALYAAKDSGRNRVVTASN